MPNTVPAAGEAMPNDDIKPFVSIGEAAASVIGGLRSSARTKPVDLNDIQADLTHLYHLLDAATDALMEVPFVRNGERDVQLDRVAALYWIARDMAERTMQDIDGNFRSIQTGRQNCALLPAEAPAAETPASTEDPVMVAISAYRGAIAAFNAIPNDVLSSEGVEGETAWVQATYGPPLAALENWKAPATSMAGAIEALRFGIEEAKQDSATPGTVCSMMAAALAFLQKGKA